MMNRLLIVSALLAASAAAGPTSAKCARSTVTEVDVAIIGGGAAGVYAATRLLDHNKTVVVLEKETQIGGQTETYYDPETGTPVNVGVKVFSNTTVVDNFLRRFDFPAGKLDVGKQLGVGTRFVDFATGRLLPNFTEPDAATQATGLERYAAQLAKYPYLKFGYNLPAPVPEDLTLPFGQFMKKYELEALADTLFDFNGGYVPLLEVPTLYILKYLDAYELQALKQGFIIASNRDTSTLYKNAARFLGDRVLYGVDRMRVERPAEAGAPITISVGGSTTGARRVRARKLIMAIPPTLANLRAAGLDVGADEAPLFGALTNGVWYSLVVKDAGVDMALTLRNRNPAKPYAYPDGPVVYSVVPQANTSGLYQVTVAAEQPLAAGAVEALVAADLARLPAAVRTANATAARPRVVYEAAHTWNVRAPVEAIKKGIYGRLEALQGERDTWYIGAAWTTSSSTTIWEGLEHVFLPKFLSTL